MTSDYFPDLTPKRSADPVGNLIARRATACAIATCVAALALYVPWYGESDRGIGDVGCAFVHGGCSVSNNAPAYSDQAAVHSVGVWPALLLFALSALASYAAVKRNRRAQKSAGVCAILIALLLGPYVFVAVALSHMLSATVSRGGDFAFGLLMLVSLATGIVNVISPVPRAPRPQVPAARARYHVSGSVNSAPYGNRRVRDAVP